MSERNSNEIHCRPAGRQQGEDNRFEGQVVACFVKRGLKTLRYVIENDDGVLHIANPRLGRRAGQTPPGAASLSSACVQRAMAAPPAPLGASPAKQ